MISVIIGTNRPNSNSKIVAEEYCRMLDALGAENTMLNLIDLPRDFVFSDMFGERSQAMQDVVDKHVSHSDKFVFIIPEYNGGFPGILKAFLDACPPSEFHGKKAALVGLSSGRAGSLRGMDQFTNVLNYLRVSVYHAKPKLSSIEQLLVNGALEDPDCLKLLQAQATGFIEF
jgi:chromate reductase